MAWRNIYYDVAKGCVHLWTWDESGRRVKLESSYEPYLYVESANTADALSIFNTPLKKIKFKNQFERNRYVQQTPIKRIFHNLSSEQEFLISTFGDDINKIDFGIQPLKIFFLDIEAVSSSEFPDPKQAKWPINLITIYDSFSKKYYTWGQRPYKPSDGDVTYFHFPKETDMLEHLLKFWEKDPPDMMVGWNCVEKSSRIWLDDRIVHIRKARAGQTLLGKDKIVNYADTGFKKAYKVITSNGSKVVCSGSHIFPVTIKHNSEYKNPNTLDRIEQKDFPVNELIDKIQSGYDVYLKNNYNTTDRTSPTLTGDACKDSLIYRFLGYIFTDGSYDKENKILSICSKDKVLLDAYVNDFNVLCEKSISGPCLINHQSGHKYHSKNFSCNGTIIERCLDLIYSTDMCTKTINIEKLSMLSRNNFVDFLLGCIDGDGNADPQLGVINLCHFDNPLNIQNIQELCFWNNISSVLNPKNTNLRLPKNVRNECLYGILSNNIRHTYRKQIVTGLLSKGRTDVRCANKKIKSFAYETYDLVKIVDIQLLEHEVEMCDIETESHYFTCNGIKTHNCEGFDVPYIMNRIGYLMGAEETYRLSPVNAIFYRENVGINKFGKQIDRWYIRGVSNIDYMEVYKTFSRGDRESYNLGFIGEYEEVGGKTDTGGENLASLMEKDWGKFVDYNIQDVRIMVKLEEKLKLLALIRVLSYKGFIPFEQSLGKVSMITGAVAHQAVSQGYRIPTFKNDSVREDYIGGYVHEPERGLSNAVCSWDANSLYPNTIVTLNISPETKIGRIVEQNETELVVKLTNEKLVTISREKFEKFIVKEQLSVSKYNVLYTQKFKGVIPNLIDRLYKERVEAKNKMMSLIDEQNLSTDEKEKNRLESLIFNLDTQQNVFKLILNSIYGVFAQKYSPLFDIDHSASITCTGQAVVKEAAEIVYQYTLSQGFSGEKKEIYKYGDTDSYSWDTQITTNLGIFDAQELHREFSKNNTTISHYGHEIVDVSRENIKVPTFDSVNNKVVWGKVKNLIKHKVSKRRFKIKVGNNQITMTEDHGCMIVREGQLTRVKPEQIRKGDKMIVGTHKLVRRAVQ